MLLRAVYLKITGPVNYELPDRISTTLMVECLEKLRHGESFLNELYGFGSPLPDPATVDYYDGVLCIPGNDQVGRLQPVLRF